MLDRDGGRCFDSLLPIATGVEDEVGDRERECVACAYSFDVDVDAVEDRFGGVGVYALGALFFSFPSPLCECSFSLSRRLGVDGELSLFPILLSDRTPLPTLTKNGCEANCY